MKEQDIFDLYDLLLEQLRDLFDGENQQLKFFPKVQKLVSSFELDELLLMHQRETKLHLMRLEGIFELLDEQPTGENCDGIKRLIKETLKLAKRCQNPEVCDAALVTSIQHINHYEMAGYGTAIAYAKVLERHDIAETLIETLREEKSADMGLSDLAEGKINANAKWTSLVNKIEQKEREIS